MQAARLGRPDKRLEAVDNLAKLGPRDEHQLPLHVDPELVLPAAFRPPRVVRKFKHVRVPGKL